MSRAFEGHTDVERFHLHVGRGRTQFPSRPIDRDGFRIGSGDGCDLQLGADEIPPEHSVLHVDEDGLRIERVASQPPLVVNGYEVDAIALHEDDVITIGEFDFEVRDTAIEIDRATPSELSAAELVELLEHDMELVASFDAGREAGADAVFAAVEERRHAEQIETLRARLEAFAETLDRRAERQAARAEILDQAAGELLGAQREIERRLTALENREADRTNESVRRAA